MSASQPSSLELEAESARLDRARQENADLSEQARKLAAEEMKLRAEELKLRAEETKFRAEELKLRFEGLKLQRDRDIAPWQIVLTAMGAGAALIAAGAGLAKILGH